MKMLKRGPKPLSSTEKTVFTGLKLTDGLNRRIKLVVQQLKDEGFSANKSKLIRALVIHGLRHAPKSIYKRIMRD